MARFYLDGQLIFRSQAEALVGKVRLRRMEEEARSADPLEEHSWWIGGGMLEIEINDGGACCVL